jgi:hypothetical protein
MRTPSSILDLGVTLNIPFSKSLVIFVLRESLYCVLSCKNTIIARFLRSRPLLRFASKAISSLLTSAPASPSYLLVDFT